MEEGWVEAGKPAEARKPYFIQTLPIGVLLRVAECLWSEPSMVPKLWDVPVRE
jgi:hypothetical protein